MVKWILIFMIYTAPDDAIDWDGPWELGFHFVPDARFDTSEECRLTAEAHIKKTQESMKAPQRFQCVAVDAVLPKGAER